MGQSCVGDLLGQQLPTWAQVLVLELIGTVASVSGVLNVDESAGVARVVWGALYLPSGVL